MSRTTRSSRADTVILRRSRWRAAFAVGLVALTLQTVATAKHLRVDAPPLPAAVMALAPGLSAQGGGEMTFLGLSIYEGWCWARAHEWTLDAPLVLDLHYRRSLSGARIAERSVSEIEGLGIGAAEQRTRWGEAMRRIFPDVVDGDRITGVFLPTEGVRYFFNGKPIGEIVDPLFARAFFGIWLDPKTSRPELRRKFLGSP